MADPITAWLVAAGMNAAVAAVVANVIVAAVTIAATTLISSFFAPKSPVGRADYNTSMQDRSVTIRSAVATHKIVYGTALVSGPIVLVVSTGSSHEYAHIFIPLAGHEVAEIGDVYFDDKISTEFNSSYYRISKHLGAADQVADSDAVSEIAEVDASFRFQGIAYLYVRFKYDNDIWPAGIPRSISAVVKGRKVYDPREITHDPADASTWAWSNNWALCLLDYIKADFGMAATDDEYDDTIYAAAANISDESVDTPGGGTQARYTCDGVIDTKDNPANNLDAMTSAGAGAWSWVSGQVRIFPGAYTSPVGTLDDDDLRGPIKIRPRSPRQDLFNGIRGVYVSPDNFWEPTDFPMVKNSTYVTQDNGEEIIRDVTLPFTIDPTRAQRICKVKLEQHRQPIVIEFPCKWKALDFSVNETVTLTLNAGRTVNIWDNKVFRITSWAPSADGGGIDLVLQEEAAANYEWNGGMATLVDPAPDTNLPSIYTRPPTVSNVVVTEEVYSHRDRSFAKLKLSFGQPTGYPYYKHAEIRHSLDDITYTYEADRVSTFYLDPVQEGVLHYFKIKSVSQAGVKTADIDDYKVSYLVLGKNTAPSSLTSLQAIPGEGSSIRLYANPVDDSDVKLYEFRLGGWSGGIFMASLDSPNLPLPGVKPGSHTFYANTKMNNGLYGDTPRSATASIADPPDGWAVVVTETCDYNGVGTHNNTEYISYSGDAYLQCIHSGNVMTGNYLSPIYDRGSADRFLVYLLADVVVTGEGTEWDTQLPLVLTGSELVTDGAFANWTADDLDSWTEVNCDAAEDVAGETGSAAKITTSAANGYVAQSITVTAGNWYRLDLYYKNTAGDSAMFGVYDATNSAWITPDDFKTLSDSTSDFSKRTYLFKAPTGCASVSLRYGARTSGDIVWFDSVSCKQIDTSTSAKWSDVNADTRSWREIFELQESPAVQMKIYYGDTSPPTNVVERMEILSAIVSGRYFQAEIIITDPSDMVHALVENFTLKFCQ